MTVRRWKLRSAPPGGQDWRAVNDGARPIAQEFARSARESKLLRGGREGRTNVRMPWVSDSPSSELENNAAESRDLKEWEVRRR